jgi:hypothetical protein
LGRGRAQGDNISPNTFNFGEQILLLKIELDPTITGVWGQVPRPAKQRRLKTKERKATCRLHRMTPENRPRERLTNCQRQKKLPPLHL